MSENVDQRHRDAMQLESDGEWDKAHQLVQRHGDAMCCRIHGYLHRVEGDDDNAAYWYRRAGEPMPSNSLDEEAQRLKTLLGEV